MVLQSIGKNDLYSIITSGVRFHSLYKGLIGQNGWGVFVRFWEHTDKLSE